MPEAGEVGEGTLLSSRDIAALNRARNVLNRVEDAAWRTALSHYDPYAPVSALDLGRLAEDASAADDAIFHVLNTARANCGANITDAQLAGAEPPKKAVKALEEAQPTEAAQPTARHSPPRRRGPST